MIPGTNQGGNIAALREVSGDRETTFLFSGVQAGSWQFDQEYTIAQANMSWGAGESALRR